jgi:N-acyl-L-homoserine lactone synthetase
MLHYSTGTREQLQPRLFEKMGEYRREVFIERLGWGLHTVGGMELDEFDGPDAVYVCSHDDEGSVNGVARLLPTTGPYLLEKVFPHLWAGQAPPKDLGVWDEKTMWMALPVLLLGAQTVHAQNREFNMICSAQAAWCNMLAVQLADLLRSGAMNFHEHLSC